MTVHAVTRPASAAEQDHYPDAGREIAVPADAADLADRIRAAEAEGRPVLPAGEGAHAAWGDPPPPGALVLSTAAFDEVALYEPDDFTIGVGAGMKLADLRALLRSHGQEIPFEWPAAAGGTVGGMVARAAGGPRQGRYGPPASFVLGVEGVRGEGRPFRAGGMVVKNVAGYQLAKLVVGAMGGAGFLLRVNFKLRPLPAARRLSVATFSTAAEAWARTAELRAARLEPAALLVLDGTARSVAAAGASGADGGATLAWVFEGGDATVAWQHSECERLGFQEAKSFSEAQGDAADELLERSAAYSETDRLSPADTGIVRLSVLPSVLPGAAAAVAETFSTLSGFEAGTLADAATGLLTVRWTGPPESIDAPVTALREIVRAKEGTGRLLHLPGSARRRHRHALHDDPNEALAEAVLAAFDPHGTFARRPA
ncbi:MAG TPA: FAD-binding oxidoreductase [bacterium]|nr:FAD-binding oxidoreductase [bacterium]